MRSGNLPPRERPRSSVPQRASRRLEDFDGDEHPLKATASGSGSVTRRLEGGPHPVASSVIADNVSYAIKTRLAFSPYLASAALEAALSYGEPPGQALPEPLSSARSLLQRTVLQRLRELQLLTEWPLCRPRRTPAQMERLLAGGRMYGIGRQSGSMRAVVHKGARASELVGVRSGPPMDLPKLPSALQGLCLLGPTDLALALAQPHAPEPGRAGGQRPGTAGGSTNREWMALSATGRGHGAAAGAPPPRGTSAAGTSGPLAALVAALPRSLGVLPGLPALAPDGAAAGAGGGAGGGTGGGPQWGWSAPSLAALREFFRDLHPHQRHVGVDDLALPWFREVKLCAARAVVAEGSARAAAAFAVFGVPNGARAAVWETALGLRRPGGTAAGAGGAGPAAGGPASAPMDQEDDALFERLCTQVLEQPLLCDLCVAEDAGPAVGDSSAFFLFEEAVRAMVLALLRDAAVAPRLAAPPLAPLQATSAVQATLAPPTALTAAVAAAAAAGTAGGSGSSTGSSGQPLWPPSGVLPYRGLCLLAAPLCYLYDRPASSYKLLRALYCRHWCRLHSLSAAGPPSPALPGLLRVFEAAMQELDAPLVSHLSRLGLLPAALVLPWISTAFAGALPVQEVLLLWDRVVALDSLLPLPLLAAAILCFRRHVLLCCGTASEVVAALSDVSQLRAVPLMQAVLFPAGPAAGPAAAAGAAAAGAAASGGAAAAAAGAAPS